ncbi:MAG: SBBP repeat-containing protein [Bacteroidales bacterium]
MNTGRFFFFWFLLLATNATINSQDLMWSTMIGSDKDEYILNHVVDSRGNIYISGKTTGNLGGINKGRNDGFIIKLDGSGKVIWQSQFGSVDDEDVQWSAIDESGNIYVTGFTTGSLSGKNHGREDLFIAKYTPSGDLSWLKQFGTDSTDIAKSVCTDGKGNVFIAGFTTGKLGNKSVGGSDCFILKLDYSGNLISTVQFGTPANDQLNSIVVNTEGLPRTCGTTWGVTDGSNKGFIDCFACWFKKDLSEPTYLQFGTDGFDIPLVVAADKDDNLYIGGSTSGSLGGDQAGDGDCFLVKVDAGKNILWKKQFGTDHHDGVRGICINEKVMGNIFVSGIMNLPPERAFVRSYSPGGDMVWEKTIEKAAGEGGASGKAITLSDDGSLVHAGLTMIPLFGPLTGGSDIYMVRYKVTPGK